MLENRVLRYFHWLILKLDISSVLRQGRLLHGEHRRPLEALLDGGAEAARSEAEEAATERDELLLD